MQWMWNRCLKRSIDTALRNIDTSLRNIDTALRNIDTALRNIDTALRNHFCRGEAISITQYECVSVVLTL